MSVPGRLRVIFIVALATRAFGQLPGLPADKLEKVEAAISAAMARQAIPGLSVAVANNRELLWANGYGLADLENNVPAKARTVYRLGSISKPITATAVMQLVERGRLDLDVPIQKYCPAFPQKAWPVTARQLLGHLSGVRHYKPGEMESTRHYDGIVDGLKIFKDDPLLFEPGTKYSYSTFGYSVLGCAIEGAGGTTYPAFVRENVFEPAGMDRIRVDEVAAIILNRAQGYERARDGQIHNSGLADTSYKVPGGGWASTVVDLARFGIALQSGKLLKPATIRKMWTSQKTRDGKETGYGLGWEVGDRDGVHFVGHGGAQQRVSTFLYLVPARGTVVAVMCNLEEAAVVVDLAKQIGDIVAQ